eukprot:CAMPEP_0174377626 /NCGR_PEP_ID=MMETSP0811_2-20130205/121560_1 /TAXON_ID=73025 ORGANISM="Eutreptiella gymnastica-like, Strain CCMP1594" /NCGR_SAMPLE_ID=MMETSP0811_2 /ASSEMBLY_ACC=CAM_ASM_000667 /LENGTH=254 /DNA_ID=CAMNT_0015529683 /DNA_START=70 /DNA_END=834 /DNA_ORIENTATION=-
MGCFSFLCLIKRQFSPRKLDPTHNSDSTATQVKWMVGQEPDEPKALVGAPVKRQDRLPAVLCGMGKSTDEDPNNLSTDAVLFEIQAVVRVLLMTAQILRRNQDMVLQAANVLEFIMTYAPELMNTISQIMAGDLSDTAIQRLSKSITSLSTACQMLSVSRIPKGQEHTAKLIEICGGRTTALARILLKRLVSDTAIQRLSKSIASLSTACQMLSVSRIPDGQEHTAKLIALCGERATILGRILLKRLVLYIVAQ